MRATRLVSLLLLLQMRGQLTAHELAGHFDVSVRTIHRDVEALSGAGVPVEAVRGPAGGYRLAGGYRTKLTGLTAAQAGARLVAPAPPAGLGRGGGAGAGWWPTPGSRSAPPFRPSCRSVRAGRSGTSTSTRAVGSAARTRCRTCRRSRRQPGGSSG